MKLTIEGKLPSANEYINAERTYRYIAAKMKREATEMVAWQCKSLEPITKLADYTFTWYTKNLRADPDNVSFAVKFVLDGLQSAGKLPNDSRKYVKSIHHEFAVGEPKVVVDIKQI